jgi:hypothetical protein
LKYGRNSIPYKVNAQAYGKGSDYTVHHTRSLPFSSVAKWVRGKSLTVSLDSSLVEERDFFRSKLSDTIPPERKFDVTQTQWFKGGVKVGTGAILSVASNTTDDYSLVLFSKDGKDAIASCTDFGNAPQLPPELEWVPINNVPKQLIASRFGSRLAAGGSSLVFDTPNGGTVSIYTMKGELVSKMLSLESRTVVKVPATHGMYIVKLEAK